MSTSPTTPVQANYLERFGLRAEPFAADPDPAFFCADSALAQRLDMLRNLTEFGLLLLLVIGESGVGKTSVLQQFFQTASSNWQILALNADDLGNAHDLVEDLATGFEVPGGDLTQLGAQLDKLRAQARLAVLLVDDAERLPDAALRTLLELSGAAGENNKRLRLVLFGTAALQHKIATLSSAHAENSHLLTISPLTELQTAAYLRHRLEVAGQTGDLPFTPAQVKSIYKFTHGVPAKINARARQMLIDIHSVSGSGASASTRARVVASAATTRGRWRMFVLAAVGVLLLAIAVWPSRDNDVSITTAALPAAPPAPQKTLAIPLPQTSGGSTPTMPLTASSASKRAPPLPMPSFQPTLERPPVTSSTGKIELSTAPALALQMASPPEHAAPLAPPMTTVTLPVPPPPNHSAALSPPLATTPTPQMAPADSSTSRSQSPEPAVAPVNLPAPRVVSKKSKTTPLASVVSTKELPSRPGDYTLQVLGGRNESAIRQFVTAHGLQDQATILHTTRQGKDWYLLLYGHYSSSAAAAAAAAKLPAAVRANHPWPRTSAAVRADSAQKP